MNGIEIIIPVKNESQNVKVLAERIDNAMNRAKLPYGMIFVDDGSTDDTIRQIEALTTRYPIKLHRRLGRPGKAFCIL
ncbi:MAG TPA: glycosyltransferase, partial [Acidobacteriota bacterium]|nr:glycosyltransferase [Acidobacteriota bacterium]